MSIPSPQALLQADDGRRWWRFREPVGVVEAHALDEVVPALREIEAAVGDGLWAVGLVAYEAAPAMDPALCAAPKGELPLAWWGLFREPEEAVPPESRASVCLDWRPLLERPRYEEAISSIRGAIERGETYQVNYTFPWEADFDGDPEALFAALHAAQQGHHSAYLDLGRFAVCSASPELFFALDGDRVTTRPMKGTARRGRWREEDEERAQALAASAKDRAENVMIVDMVRNDLGQVARPGSVRVGELCRVETYPTVHQMTSTVRAETSAPFTDLFRALFPSASITGAPKVSTSRIIRQLEVAPRGVYTGAVGYLGPGRRASWNVAIRTVTVDRETRRARYGTGGGIVWDSDARSEYEECRAKALVLTAGGSGGFELLETLLWRPVRGYVLLERHLARLLASAAFFGFACDEETLRRRLAKTATDCGGAGGGVPTIVRLLVDRRGDARAETRPGPDASRETWTVRLDDRPIDAEDVFFHHKTTRRGAYDEALARHPGLDDVLLWNERGELTESTRANLALRLGGELWTPPRTSGLLPGTFRAALLERGRLRERVLPKELLREADEVVLLSSVRGFVRTRLVI